MAEDRKSRLGLWLIVVGPGVWAVHFVACYAVAAVLCEKSGGAGSGWLIASIIVLTLIALAVLGVVLFRTMRQWGFLQDFVHKHDQDTAEGRYRFLGHAAFLLSALSALGVVYTALPALLIPGVCQ